MILKKMFKRKKINNHVSIKYVLSNNLKIKNLIQINLLKMILLMIQINPIMYKIVKTENLKIVKRANKLVIIIINHYILNRYNRRGFNLIKLYNGLK